MISVCLEWLNLCIQLISMRIQNQMIYHFHFAWRWLIWSSYHHVFSRSVKQVTVDIAQHSLCSVNSCLCQINKTISFKLNCTSNKNLATFILATTTVDSLFYVTEYLIPWFYRYASNWKNIKLRTPIFHYTFLNSLHLSKKIKVRFYVDINYACLIRKLQYQCILLNVYLFNLKWSH